MNGKPSPILIGSAAVIGLFFGNAMGSVLADITGSTIKKGSFDWQSALMALLVGGLAAAGAERISASATVTRALSLPMSPPR